MLRLLLPADRPARSLPLRAVAAALAVAVPIVACATSRNGPTTEMGGDAGGPGVFGNPTRSLDGGRAARCDDGGRCTCFNIASIGLPGHTGFQGGQNGADNTSAFTDYLNAQSSAGVDMYKT